MEYTESLPPPPSTHEACRLPQSLAYEAQVCLTLAWPGRTESRPVICRPTWPLANTGRIKWVKRAGRTTWREEDVTMKKWDKRKAQ